MKLPLRYSYVLTDGIPASFARFLRLAPVLMHSSGQAELVERCLRNPAVSRFLRPDVFYRDGGECLVRAHLRIDELVNNLYLAFALQLFFSRQFHFHQIVFDHFLHKPSDSLLFGILDCESQIIL